MSTPENEDPNQQALRLAQLEIKMLREQLLQAIEQAKTARAETSAQTERPASTPPSIVPRAAAPEKEIEGNVHEVNFRPDRQEVLCVEDSEANFQLIQTILSDRPGTNLAWAENGQKGLELARTQNPQLVLLDLDLPDMHGSEVLGKLREFPATAQTPVIVISADATPSQIERMLAAGARDYITKPFEIRRFLLMFDEIFPQAAAS